MSFPLPRIFHSPYFFLCIQWSVVVLLPASLGPHWHKASCFRTLSSIQRQFRFSHWQFVVAMSAFRVRWTVGIIRRLEGKRFEMGQKWQQMSSAQWQSRILIVQSVDAYRTRGLYVHSYIMFVQYWRVCRTSRVCMCVQCSHRQTHGSLRSGEYYRGVDHRRTRPITNRQAPHINPLHSDASPLCLSVSLSFFFFFFFFRGSALSHSSPFSLL